MKKTEGGQAHSSGVNNGRFLFADIKKNDAALGFAMGCFKQYDDIIGYALEEIVIAYEYQNQGMGGVLLRELERIVKENDEHHEKYYGKAGYHNAKSFVMKVKWFE